MAEVKAPTVSGGISCSIVVDGLKLIDASLLEWYKLFDLNRDPGEENNLISDTRYREKAEDLKARLNRIRREDFLKLGPVKRRESFTVEEIEKLRSLGYTR